MNITRTHIIGGGIAVVVFAIILLVILLRGPKCDFVEEVPKAQEFDKLTNVISKDQTAIGKMDAYIKFIPEFKKNETQKKTYLSLNFKSVTVGVPAYQAFSMEADCGTVSLNIDSTVASLTKVNLITIDYLPTKTGNKLVCSPQGSLDTKPGRFISWPAGNHFRCQKPIIYECKEITGDSMKKGIVAQIEIQSIEFELNGDAEKIAKGEYSTDAKDCE